MRRSHFSALRSQSLCCTSTHQNSVLKVETFDASPNTVGADVFARRHTCAPPPHAPTFNAPQNNRGNTYEGFFLDHNRSGTGTLFRGNVKRVYDPRSGRKALRSNRIYEGTWRANELRTGSMVSLRMYEKPGNQPPTRSGSPPLPSSRPSSTSRPPPPLLRSSVSAVDKTQIRAL